MLKWIIPVVDPGRIKPIVCINQSKTAGGSIAQINVLYIDVLSTHSLVLSSSSDYCTIWTSCIIWTSCMNQLYYMNQPYEPALAVSRTLIKLSSGQKAWSVENLSWKSCFNPGLGFVCVWETVPEGWGLSLFHSFSILGEYGSGQK